MALFLAADCAYGEGTIMSDLTDTLITRLAAIPERIHDATRGWVIPDLTAPPMPGKWSAAEILALIRASDAIMRPRIYHILVRDNPPLPAFDEHRWAEVAGYSDMTFDISLQAYTLLREELVAMLRRLSPEDWLRTGMHEDAGPLSVRDIAQRLAEREEEHCQQLEALYSE
jgi:hypothetical protein